MDLKERLRHDIMATRNARYNAYKRVKFFSKLLKFFIFCSFLLSFLLLINLHFQNMASSVAIKYLFVINIFAFFISLYNTDENKFYQNRAELGKLLVRLDLAEDEDELAEINDIYCMILNNSNSHSWFDYRMYQWLGI